MKFYHLADLHFGKSIYGLSMLDDQRYWADQFIELCSNEKPDAIVIAGDIYDRSSPSGDAVELLDYFLTSLAEKNIPVMMIAGNHDSGQRLSFGKTMLSRQNLHIAGIAKKEIEHITFENLDENGPITFWMLPYTYPEQISLILNDEEIRTYDQAIRKLIELQKIDSDQRNIIIAHQNVIADGKEIERGGSESMVGGVGQIDYSVFDAFDYAALGHIHSSYPVGRKEVRYAGTPLCYHFSETRQKEKGIIEVTINDKDAPVEIRTIEITPLHKMRSLEGTKDEIYEILREDKGKNEYVGITLTDQRITPEIASYLKQLLNSRGSILMELLSSYSSFNGTISSAEREAVENKAIEDLFADLYTEQNGGTPATDEEYGLMAYVGELVRNQDSHLPIDMKDVNKLLDKAQKIGGENR
jgi:exonuclease SbcD